MSPSSGIPPRSLPYLLLELLFTIPRASEMKAGAKSSLLLHPLHPGRYIGTNDQDSIKIYKNRNATLPPSASRTFPCLGPNQPISALSSDSSTKADRDHAVPSRFIVSPACHPCFSEPTCPFSDLILDVVRTGCKSTPLLYQLIPVTRIKPTVPFISD